MRKKKRFRRKRAGGGGFGPKLRAKREISIAILRWVFWYDKSLYFTRPDYPSTAPASEFRALVNLIEEPRE
jgi:hypothetical protein